MRDETYVVLLLRHLRALVRIVLEWVAELN